MSICFHDWGGCSVSQHARERSDRAGGGCGRGDTPPTVGTFSKLEYQNRIFRALKNDFLGIKRSQISRRRTN